jgi:hypothetical protein
MATRIDDTSDLATSPEETANGNPQGHPWVLSNVRSWRKAGIGLIGVE